jgi:hypothetical protein
MTVKELKEALKEFNDDDLVVMSKDSEGNNFSPLYPGLGDQRYVARSDWHGDIVDTEDEEDQPACVLWPTN